MVPTGSARACFALLFDLDARVFLHVFFALDDAQALLRLRRIRSWAVQVRLPFMRASIRSGSVEGPSRTLAS
ncbi:MAG: hypothetical protein BRD47_02945 [Bacteroidetes bacterium QS_8_68_28]|nr:MAG: hypothetical protein BRD47_02945 [Bacteroidetes bacterium QS_8_68_28]